MLEIIVIIQGNIEVLRIAYVIVAKSSYIFCIESNFDYHFFMKELEEEFKKQSTCL